MTDYTKLTDFAAKDSLLSGNPAKVVRGTEIDAEFTNIAVAVATKTDDAAAAITGGTIDGVAVTNSTVNSTPIGGSTPAAGAFTTVSASGQVTSTVSTGTAPLVIASTTKVANLNVDQLDGADWASPAAIGSGTPAAGAFTTLSATGDIATENATYLKTKTSGGTSVRMMGINGSNTAYVGPIDTATGLTTAIYGGASSITVHDFYTGGSLRGEFNNTGLAVTGALSATGKVAFGTVSTAAAQVNVLQTASGRGQGVQISTAGGAGSISWVDSLGLAYDAASHVFYDGATEYMRLTSGNLGLGVTPSARTSGKSIEVGTTGCGISSETTSRTRIFSNWTNNSGDKYVSTAPAAMYLQNDGSHVFYTAPSGTAGNAITFTQAMTLDASGNHLVGLTDIGTLTPNGFFVNPSASGSNIGVTHGTGTASGVAFEQYFYNGTVIGSISQNGTTAVAYNTTSDHRLKENVRPADAARFMDIEFVDFEWVDGRHDCGVIADQLQSVYPDLVLGEKDATEVRTVEITPAIPEVKDEDGNVTQEAVPAVTEEQTFPVYQQVNYIGLIGRMGTRVQQLQRTVDAQAALIAAMEARLTALEAA